MTADRATPAPETEPATAVTLRVIQVNGHRAIQDSEELAGLTMAQISAAIEAVQEQDGKPWPVVYPTSEDKNVVTP